MTLSTCVSALGPKIDCVAWMVQRDICLSVSLFMAMAVVICPQKLTKQSSINSPLNVFLHSVKATNASLRETTTETAWKCKVRREKSKIKGNSFARSRKIYVVWLLTIWKVFVCFSCRRVRWKRIANEHRRCCHEVFFGDGGVGEGVQWQGEHLLKLGQFSGQVISLQI